MKLARYFQALKSHVRILLRIVAIRRRRDEPMIHIRLWRHGRASSPGDRIVVSSKARGSDYIERIGHYDPQKYNSTTVKEDRALHWLREGAQPQRQSQGNP